MRRSVAVREDDEGETFGGDAPALRIVRDQAGGHPATMTAWLNARIDRVIGACSLVSTAALLDVRDFAWTRLLREQWRAIRAEAEALPADARLTPAHCPITAAAVAGIPGFRSARFDRIGHGTRFAPRDAAGRAVLACQLGLRVPRDGDVRMRLGERVVRWAEGETLLFDATQASARHNDSASDALLLTVELRRPLRQPGRWIADALLRRAH